MSEIDDLLDIPGTTVVTAAPSRKGYHLNQFCMSLMQGGNRAAFKADESTYLDAWPLTPAQRAAVLARDYNAAIAEGGNIYFLAKIFSTDGLSFQQAGADDEAIAGMAAGKHVQVEIPLADSLSDAEAVLAKAQVTGLTCMVGHTRRFNPSHQYINNLVTSGALNLQQMDVQTYFFRRRNINAKGEARSWTDHLLWHHAAHTVDLFAYQAGPIVKANALAGPLHPKLGIAMDMSIQLKAASGAICTLSQVAVSINGIELQDREFIAAIREGREPNASVAQVLPCYRILADLESQLA